MPRKPILAANWKMNLGRADEAIAFLRKIRPGLSEIEGLDLVLCPPITVLSALAELLGRTRIALGAQDAHWESSGAYTGEVSAAMLAEFGCRYVIVGHSERRQIYGESDAQVAAKFAAVQAAGMLPIVCVGETLEERDAGQTERTVARQIDAVLAAGASDALAKAVLAYEPVWAIGTGRNATPQQAQDVHAFLRARVAARDRGVAQALRILYGGSVKPANAGAIFAMPDVDGGLIGGASLVASDFLAIAAAAAS